GSIIIDQDSSINFTGDATFSLDGTGAIYDWNFGDGSVAFGENVSHTFSTIGTFTVTLTVTDTNPTGCSDSATIVVQVLGPYLNIDQTTYTVIELVKDILIDTSCAEISNVISSTGTDFGSTNGLGYFSGNGLNFPFTEGIILTTGDASEAEGPESATLSSGSTAWPGDEDLENAIPDLNIGDTNNATFIQFDFVPLSPSMSFNFVFASEEYGGFQCQFTDAFAFLLTDNETGITTNLALVPGTNDPISVLSVRDNTHNSSCNSVNEDFFEAFYGGTGLPEIDSPTEFRGHTVSMAAQSTVVPNRTYTIKLVIADDGDTLFDAAVFLEGGSFDLGGNLGEDITIEGGTALCEGDTITLDSQLPTAEHIWYLNGEIIEGEISSVLEISEAGEYSADIIFGEDCSTSDTVLIEYKPTPTIEDIADLSLCNAGTPEFDLTDNNILILGSQNPNNFNITYHNSIEDAENDYAPIETNLTNYTLSTNTETISVRIEDAITETCFLTASFDLILTGAPPISEVSDLVLCDDTSNDDIEEFNLELQNSDILGGLTPANYNITYYTSFDDANSSQNELPLLYTSVTNQPIFVRLDSVDDEACFNVSPDPLFNLIVNNKATATAPSDLSDCDTSTTGAVTSTFDLEEQTGPILGIQDPSTFTVTYHSTPEEANSGANPLSSPLTTTTRTIYVRVEEDGLPDCYETTQFEITINPNPEVLNQTTTICSTSAVDLTLGDDADGPSVVSYDLTAITPEAGLVAGGSNAVEGTNLSSDAIDLDEWTNTSTTPLDVVYSFIPYDAVGCFGPSFTVTVTVSPEPEVLNQTTTICSTSTVDLTLGDDADGPSVVSYELTAITPASGLVADAANATVGTNLASDAIALDVWTNTTTTAL
ncbi:PKD domain-containing protein, partial [Flavobacteriaceae bacterium]|nr:PKD domain-containing protein [Flavobacteriaceae bacterium]